MFIPAVLCAVFSALPGCVTQPPVAVEAPPVPMPVGVGKSNRFEMTQNGRKMSARDFDEWMKVRGIRIAKGASHESAAQAATQSAGKTSLTISGVSQVHAGKQSKGVAYNGTCQFPERPQHVARTVCAGCHQGEAQSRSHIQGAIR